MHTSLVETNPHNGHTTVVSKNKEYYAEVFLQHLRAFSYCSEPLVLLTPSFSSPINTARRQDLVVRQPKERLIGTASQAVIPYTCESSQTKVLASSTALPHTNHVHTTRQASQRLPTTSQHPCHTHITITKTCPIKTCKAWPFGISLQLRSQCGRAHYKW